MISGRLAGCAISHSSNSSSLIRSAHWFKVTLSACILPTKVERQFFARSRLSGVRLAHHARNQHRHLQGLLIIQTWIHLGTVSALEVVVAQVARAAQTLRDILARQLEMHAAQAAGAGAVNRERLL